MAAFQKPPTVSDDYRAVEIYREAANIIYEKGFDATSMGDIAEAVDLTKGGLYYYIKGKKALLYAIMDFAMNRLEAEVLEPARKEEDPELRLEILLSGHAELVIEDTSALTILVYEEEGLDEAHRPKIRQRKRAYADFLRDTIMAVLERHGRTGKIDPSMASSSVLGTIHWIVRWHKPKSRLSHEEVVDQVTELIMHGLVPLRA
ncbi:MAG TPA: TetR/AcrR family transcriptional regulator [Thermoanaerobaculia bacterium]|jgi:AcrR family transcriptional regulator